MKRVAQGNQGHGEPGNRERGVMKGFGIHSSSPEITLGEEGEPVMDNLDVGGKTSLSQLLGGHTRLLGIDSLYARKKKRNSAILKEIEGREGGVVRGRKAGRPRKKNSGITVLGKIVEMRGGGGRLMEEGSKWNREREKN